MVSAVNSNSSVTCHVCNQPFNDLRDKSALLSASNLYAHNNPVYKSAKNADGTGSISCIKAYYTRLNNLPNLTTP